MGDVGSGYAWMITDHLDNVDLCLEKGCPPEFPGSLLACRKYMDQPLKRQSEFLVGGFHTTVCKAAKPNRQGPSLDYRASRSPRLSRPTTPDPMRLGITPCADLGPKGEPSWYAEEAWRQDKLPSPIPPDALPPEPVPSQASPGFPA